MEKGAINAKHVIPKTNLWIYRTSALPVLTDEYNEFISLFKARWHSLKEIINEGGEVDISIIIKIEDEYPSILIPHALVQTASEFGSCIDIAFYDDINDNEVSKAKLDVLDIQNSSELHPITIASSGWLENIDVAWEKLKLHEAINSSLYKDRLIINVNKKMRLPSGYINEEIIDELARFRVDVEIKYCDQYD